MTPHDPAQCRLSKRLRARHDVARRQTSHDDGRIRATEVRASDFIGPVRRAISGCSSRASSRTRVARSLATSTHRTVELHERCRAHPGHLRPGTSDLGVALARTGQSRVSVRQAIDDIARIVGRHERQDHQGPDAGAGAVGLFKYRHSANCPRRCTSSRSRSSSTTPRHELPSVSCRTPWDESLEVVHRVLFQGLTDTRFATTP